MDINPQEPLKKQVKLQFQQQLKLQFKPQHYSDDGQFFPIQFYEFETGDDHESNAIFSTPHLKISIVTETWSPEINGVYC